MDCLIVFVKNMLPGKVKTRLAAEIGVDQTMEVYRRLVDHTREVVAPMTCETRIFYSDHIEEDKPWLHALHHVQQGDDLGSRMQHAISVALHTSTRVVLIGSDSPDIDTRTIQEAFQALRYSDVVIGPSEDGGYYLIGMHEPHPELFIDIPWSTPAVYRHTRQRLLDRGINFAIQRTCMDIDTRADALRAGWIMP